MGRYRRGEEVGVGGYRRDEEVGHGEIQEG